MCKGSLKTKGKIRVRLGRVEDAGRNWNHELEVASEVSKGGDREVGAGLGAGMAARLRPPRNLVEMQIIKPPGALTT